MISRRRFLLTGALFATALSSFAIATETGTAIHTLYLVRHGRYDFMEKADDKTANALNALGREQATLIGDRLAALPVKFHTVVSSEFTRARETGDIIAAKLGANCARDGLLNECTPPGADIAANTVEPGAEAQLQRAWARYAIPTPATATHDLLVCHGNVIRWFVCKALGVDVNQWPHMDIANASLTVITVKPDGGTRLEIYSEVAHLPIAKQTWSGKGPGWVVPVAK